MQNAHTDVKTDESEKKIRAMIRRRITGIVLAAVFFVMWILQGWSLRIGFVAMTVMSIWEMYGAFQARGAKPIKWIGMAYAVMMLPGYLYMGLGGMLPMLAICCMMGLAGVIWRGEVDFDSAMATILPLIYPGCLLPLFFAIMDIKLPAVATLAVGLMFLIALMNDLMAYEVGMRIGKKKLSPILSPKKTVEGSIAGICASVIIAMVLPQLVRLATVYVPFWQQYQTTFPPFWFFALMGLVGGVMGQVGDLTASMIKRYCGIKDFGAIFPGHGGMLDRIDSILFTGVVVYVFFALAQYI